VIRYEASLDTFSEAGASASGTAHVGEEPVAEITMLFSHIDQNMAGVEFPEHNFVFTPQFIAMLKANAGSISPNL
jgi:hypothetical protein